MLMSNFAHRKHTDSLKSAISGLITAFRTQPNFKIMFLAVFCVLCAGIILKINYFEWLFLILSIALVYMAEMINTAIEAMVDLVTNEWRQDARIAKDVGGGMVLLSVIFTLIVGVVIFLPKLLTLFTYSNF